MSAFMNALREEGTKEDCLIRIERLLDERAELQACLAEAVEVMRTIVGTLDDPTGGQHVADMRSASATARAFIVKMESKP